MAGRNLLPNQATSPQHIHGEVAESGLMHRS